MITTRGNIISLSPIYMITADCDNYRQEFEKGLLKSFATSSWRCVWYSQVLWSSKLLSNGFPVVLS